MDMFILLTLLQMLSLNEAYNFTCPSQAHWNLRAKSMCNPERNYTCLFNVTFRVNVYNDTCNRPRLLGPGYKYVFQPNLNRATCSATRYQPFLFDTNGNSDCTYQKSLCNSLGQETYHDGNTTVDRKCICNTARGYSFVRNPKNQCYCDPSTEDCSCYLGINPYNETIKTKDINCCDDIEMTGISYLGDRYNMYNISRKIKIVEFDNYIYNVHYVPTNLYRILAAILVLILSFACVVVLIIVQRAIRGWIKTRSTPRKLDIVECTDCSITIEWFIDVPDECLSYALDYRPQRTKDWSTGTFLSKDVLKEEYGQRMYKLQNLQPETYYELKMRSVYEEDVKSHYSESKTKQTLKLAPRKLDIVECTDCSITIEWFIDVPDECLSYELDYRPQRTKDWSTGTFLSKDVLKEEYGRRMYKLQNLQPETYYELKMRSVYEEDVKSHYSESKTKQTLKLETFNTMVNNINVMINIFGIGENLEMFDATEQVKEDVKRIHIPVVMQLDIPTSWDKTKVFEAIDGFRLNGTTDMNIRIKAISIEDIIMYAEVAERVLCNVHKLRSEINKLMSTMISEAEINTTEHAEFGVNMKIPDLSENKPSKEDVQDQTSAKTNLPVSVNLRKQLNIKQSTNENLLIISCIKTGNTLVFTDYENNRLIICNSDGTDIHYIPLSYEPLYITEIDSNTVAVSRMDDYTIQIINISTRSITSTITSGGCWGISYNDNNLYVVIDQSRIRVMDLTGKVIRTIPVPSDDIYDITVDRDRLVCIDTKSIYCCSLDGKLMWKFKKDEIQDLQGVTTDNEGNVYGTNASTSTVLVVSDDGKQHRKLLTKSDGLNEPCGIYFDKTENILLVCNERDGNAFLFDVIKKLT